MDAEHIFHIALTRDWEAARAVGEYRVSTVGASLDEVGFIHGSYRGQVERIGSFLYGGVAEPVTVLDIDPRRLSVPVVVETSTEESNSTSSYITAPSSASCGISTRTHTDPTHSMPTHRT